MPPTTTRPDFSSHASAKLGQQDTEARPSEASRTLEEVNVEDGEDAKRRKFEPLGTLDLIAESKEAVAYMFEKRDAEPDVVRIEMEIPMKEYLRNPLIAFSKRLEHKGGAGHLFETH